MTQSSIETKTDYKISEIVEQDLESHTFDKSKILWNQANWPDFLKLFEFIHNSVIYRHMLPVLFNPP